MAIAACRVKASIGGLADLSVSNSSSPIKNPDQGADLK
jgi:hypothetical protein